MFVCFNSFNCPFCNFAKMKKIIRHNTYKWCCVFSCQQSLHSKWRPTLQNLLHSAASGQELQKRPLSYLSVAAAAHLREIKAVCSLRRHLNYLKGRANASKAYERRNAPIHHFEGHLSGWRNILDSSWLEEDLSPGDHRGDWNEG